MRPSSRFLPDWTAETHFAQSEHSDLPIWEEWHTMFDIRPDAAYIDLHGPCTEIELPD